MIAALVKRALPKDVTHQIAKNLNVKDAWMINASVFAIRIIACIVIMAYAGIDVGGLAMNAVMVNV